MRYLFELCKEKKTSLLRRTLLETQDLLRNPLTFWEGVSHQTDQGDWRIRAFSEELTLKCVKCRRIWPAHQLAKEGCTDCKVNPHWKQISPKKKGARPKLQQTLGIVMRSALPEEIEKLFHHNLISDSTLTAAYPVLFGGHDQMQEMGILATDAPTGWVTPVPIRLWFTVPELGHSLIDDNHDRPLHPLTGPFLRRYLSRFEDMDDDDDEMGRLYTGLCDTRGFARTMLEDWEINHAVEDNDIGKPTAFPNQHLCRNRERFSIPLTARYPNFGQGRRDRTRE